MSVRERLTPPWLDGTVFWWLGAFAIAIVGIILATIVDATSLVFAVGLLTGFGLKTFDERYEAGEIP